MKFPKVHLGKTTLVCSVQYNGPSTVYLNLHDHSAEAVHGHRDVHEVQDEGLVHPEHVARGNMTTTRVQCAPVNHRSLSQSYFRDIPRSRPRARVRYIPRSIPRARVKGIPRSIPRAHLVEEAVCDLTGSASHADTEGGLLGHSGL